jgi:hypothetical protein
VIKRLEPIFKKSKKWLEFFSTEWKTVLIFQAIAISRLDFGASMKYNPHA